MKAIKITAANTSAIEAALHEINGRAHDHTYNYYSEVSYEAEQAEKKTVALVGAKDRSVGAIWSVTSGGRVANSYKYSRIGTTIKIERRASGWFLVDVSPARLYNEGGGSGRLTLTKEQDEAACAMLRKQYRVAQDTV